MSDGQAPLGICCPRCGCPDLRVTRTMRLPGGRVRRYRECRHCGRRVCTLELPPSQARVAISSNFPGNFPPPA